VERFEPTHVEIGPDDDHRGHPDDVAHHQQHDRRQGRTPTTAAVARGDYGDGRHTEHGYE
jgi:hypothetical protein